MSAADRDHQSLVNRMLMLGARRPRPVVLARPAPVNPIVAALQRVRHV